MQNSLTGFHSSEPEHGSTGTELSGEQTERGEARSTGQYQVIQHLCNWSPRMRQKKIHEEIKG